MQDFILFVGSFDGIFSFYRFLHAKNAKKHKMYGRKNAISQFPSNFLPTIYYIIQILIINSFATNFPTNQNFGAVLSFKQGVCKDYSKMLQRCIMDVSKMFHD